MVRVTPVLIANSKSRVELKKGSYCRTGLALLLRILQPELMKLGDQTAPTNDVHLKYLARYGVQNICGYPQIKGDRLYATVDELRTMMDMAGKYGISVDCTAPPFLESSFIDTEKHPAIMLARSPERDRDIEGLQIYIRNSAEE